MSNEALARFVDDWASGRIFSDRHVDGPHLQLVFLPLALGALSKLSKKHVASIGLIYADGSDRKARMSVNGMPIFASCRLMHKKDWALVVPAIEAELERRKKIVVPVPTPKARRK
jgi:hypothetical protein